MFASLFTLFVSSAISENFLHHYFSLLLFPPLSQYVNFLCLHFCLFLSASVCFLYLPISPLCVYFFLFPSVSYPSVSLSLAVSVFFFISGSIGFSLHVSLFLPPFLTTRTNHRMGCHFIQLFSYGKKYLRIVEIQR